MLNKKFIKTTRDGARALTGYKRRAFIAQVSTDYFNGNARITERIMGWGRKTVQTGLNELRSGLRCFDNYSGRGNKRTEEKLPRLVFAVREIVEPHAQTDPDFSNAYAYLKITAKSVRNELKEKGYAESELPTRKTVGKILNRLGYSLKRVQKKPFKKIKETDSIFENVAKNNQEADVLPDVLRISLDTKAKVKIGEFSRNGKVRTRREIKGLDHDHNPKAVLVPLGILNTETNRTDIIFGNSSETSDFIVDGIEIWWEANQKDYPHIKKLMINLDNGPSVSGNRTQFLKRMAAFSKQTNLKIHLVYYPPYHSKYNPVERCWSALERHWNGSILSSVEIAVNWASTLTWKGIKTCVRFVDKVYEKGVTLTKQEMMKYETQIKRSADLPKWDIIISPLSG